jgi:hypothetical protein
MADGEDIQPLVCDNGTGMVKVSQLIRSQSLRLQSPQLLVTAEVLTTTMCAVFSGWIRWR